MLNMVCVSQHGVNNCSVARVEINRMIGKPDILQTKRLVGHEKVK